MSMVGSFIVDFDKDNFIVSPYYKVTVNGVLRYSHTKDALQLYSTHISVGDVVTFEIFNTSEFDNNITLTRIDYTTENSNSDFGVKETTITGVTNSSSFTYTFTASTISIAYGFEYRITGNIQSTCFSYSTLFNDEVLDVKLYEHRIYISGLFTTVNGISIPHFTVLNQNGTIYSGFTNYGLETDTLDLPFEIQSDGKILIYVRSYDGNDVFGICRINADGTFDNTFSKRRVEGELHDIEIQSDGKILIAGLFSGLDNPLVSINSIARLNSDGTTDNTFTSPFLSTDIIQDIDIQSDGKILVMGEIATFNGICRLNSDGSIDNSFSNPFILQTSSVTRLGRIKQLSSGKILVAGRQMLNNNNYYYFARLNSNGSIDNTFNNRTSDIFVDELIGYDFYELSDNKIILIYGRFLIGDVSVIKLYTDGLTDTTFSEFFLGYIGLDGAKENIAVDETFQKLYIGGTFFSVLFSNMNVVYANNFVVSNLKGEDLMC